MGYVPVLREGKLALWCPVDDDHMNPGLLLRMRVEHFVEENFKGAKWLSN
jgi:hypothetical protein